MAKKSVVALAKEPTIQESVSRVFELLGGVEKLIEPGDSVVLKPNAGHAAPPESAVCTNPEVVRAVIREVKKAKPSKLVIAEAAAVGCDTMECFRVSGIAKVAEEEGVELVDIKSDKDLINIPVRGYRSNIKRVKLPRFLLEADHIINLPILKAHASMVCSCALKNIKGTVQDRVHMDMHKQNLTMAMMDVWYAVRADINIVDAIYAAGGFSPHTPVPLKVGCILGSTDPVAVDRIACDLVGIDTTQVDYFKTAREAGMGHSDLEEIDVVGEKVRDCFTRMWVPYVQLPKFEEYKEWFKDYFDMRREDGILEVTMKTGEHPMNWSGGAHRAMSQLTRVISLDHENEILIWTHKGPHWMQDSDPNGWERYGQERFQHQYFDDTNLIKNMIFDLEIPTIAAMQGPGFHWDSAILCDITIVSDDCKFDDPHLHYGLVPGDGTGLLLQTLLGTKRGNYYMYTSRQFTAQQALDWGWVSEVVPKGTVLDRAWEIARMIKSVPYETRTITSYLAKRPLEKMYVEDLKLHTVNEQLSTYIKIAQGNLGGYDKGQKDEAYHGLYARWKYAAETTDMLQPQNLETWDIHEKAVEWDKKNPKGY